MLTPLWVPFCLLAAILAVAVPVIAYRAAKERQRQDAYADAAPQCRYCHRHAVAGRLCRDHYLQRRAMIRR